MFQFMKKLNFPFLMPVFILLVLSSCRKPAAKSSRRSEERKQLSQKVDFSAPSLVSMVESDHFEKSLAQARAEVLPGPEIPEVPPKKKILIYSCKGGGGHTAASNALVEYLRDDYEVRVVNLIEEVLCPLDPVRKVTQQQYHASDMYNMLLKANVPLVTNTLSLVGQWAACWQGNRIEPLIQESLEELKPDLVMSVMPVFNGSILEVTEKLNIPFTVIALDRDMVRIGFLNGINNPTHPNFCFGVPFFEPKLQQVVEGVGIKPECVRAIGVPVRKSFFEKRDRAALRAELGVPAGVPVVTVLMGSAGSKSTLRYAKRLSTMRRPLHIFLCLGKNEALREPIQALSFPPHITVSIIGFTDRIADFMAAADVLITKPGAVSVFEALVIGVPMIIDNNVLAWEASGIDLIEEQGFGERLWKMRKLPAVLNRFLDPAYNRQVRARMRHYALPNALTSVKLLLGDMLARQETLQQAQLFEDALSDETVLLK